MKFVLSIITGVILCWITITQPASSQTRIGKEQIEDAFLLKTGGAVYGDVSAATSTVNAATLSLQTDEGFFQLFKQGPYVVLRSNLDLYLDPSNQGTAGGKIIPATMMEFADFLGDKVRFYSHTYKMGVSPYTLDITSDRNIKFHSDTVPDLMTILGDQGDVVVKQDLYAGRDIYVAGGYRFNPDSEGDKILLYGTLYRLAISSNTLDFYSDRLFEWHTDTHADAMQLNGDTGRLTLSGPLKLSICTSLPTGEPGDLIYLDHPSDDTQDGVYVRCSTNWQKCN